MKVCFFGSYERNYSKNIVLLNGLKANKVSVVHCYHPNYFTPTHYPSLFWQFITKGYKADIIYIAFFGHYDVWFGWILAKIFRKKLIFDPLISIYNTRIEDRKYFRKGSLRAKFYILFDTINCLLADRIILDTKEHFRYFNKLFHLKSEKTWIIPVGADEKILRPKKTKKNKKLTILWYGSYQPSQGAIKIVQAAKMIRDKNIEFILVGNGQQYQKVEKFVKRNELQNVKLITPVSFRELIELINRADILLGVFGNTVKTRMVIHNKIYQSLAMGKILITQKAAVIEEILTDGLNAVFIKPEPKDMANKIILVSKKINDYKSVGRNARILFLENFTGKKIGHSLTSLMQNLIQL